MRTHATGPAHAIITGGSRGIGLATAAGLVTRGFAVTLIARNQDRLEQARLHLTSTSPGEARVAAISADVGDEVALRRAIDQSIDQFGPPAWAVSCAGIVKPGLFLDLSLEDHLAQLRTNYIGSLYFAHIVIPRMVDGGHLVFVATGAAIVGIYGYSGYGASKFAVRGLAEVLRVELMGRGIIVTLVHPPDTDTPQLAAEEKTRPEATRRISGAAGVWKPKDVAAALIQGARAGRFIVAPGWQLGVLASIHSIISPAFRFYQQHVASRTSHEP